MKRDFLILGNGMSGTSLMHSMIDTHPQIDCQFEQGDKLKDFPVWIEDARKCPNTWGNKVPIEKLMAGNWQMADLIDLIESFYIINPQRKFTGYLQSYKRKYTHRPLKHLPKEEQAAILWEQNNELYYAMLEKNPEKIIRVSFEHLVLYPGIEMDRIFRYLHVRTGNGEVQKAINHGPGKIRYGKAYKHLRKEIALI